jgi:hypothetical protein
MGALQAFPEPAIIVIEPSRLLPGVSAALESTLIMMLSLQKDPHAGA